MNIAIIGAGNVGTSLAKPWTTKGHKIVFGVRDPASPKSKSDVGAGAKLATVKDAASASDVIVLATPWPATQAALKEAGDIKGKIVIDCTNPVKPDLSGLELGQTTSAGEKVAEWAKGASVFKSFNQTGAANMADQKGYPQKPVMFVCGDDAGRKPTVMTLVSDAGFEAIDAGGIQISRLVEPMAMLWIHLAIAQKLGPGFAYGLLRRKS
jgi:hypothetical protein